jgi:hypothetical protein
VIGRPGTVETKDLGTLAEQARGVRNSDKRRYDIRVEGLGERKAWSEASL